MPLGRYTIDMCKTRFHISKTALIVLMAMISTSGCSPQTRVGNPLETLNQTNVSPRKHIAAMQMLDGQPDNEDYLKALKRLIFVPGYTVAVRRQAFDRLEAIDEAELKRTIRQQFPRLQAPMWKEELLNLIATG